MHKERIIKGTKEVENDFRGMWYGDHVIKKKGNKGPETEIHNIIPRLFASTTFCMVQ